jgi:hypothetical protein
MSENEERRKVINQRRKKEKSSMMTGRQAGLNLKPTSFIRGP